MESFQHVILVTHLLWTKLDLEIPTAIFDTSFYNKKCSISEDSKVATSLGTGLLQE